VCVCVFVSSERSRLDKTDQIESGVFMKAPLFVQAIHHFIYISFCIIFYVLTKLCDAEAFDDLEASSTQQPCVQLFSLLEPEWDLSHAVTINPIKQNACSVPVFF